MKKVFMLLTMMVLMASLGLAAASKGKVEFGLKGGYIELEGFKTGVFLDYELGKNLWLQTEIYYSQRKYRYSSLDIFAGDPPGTEIPMTDLVKTIEVPVLLKYRVNLEGPLRPIVFGGGYLAFNLDRNTEEIIGSFEPLSAVPGQPYFLIVEPTRKYSQAEAGVVLGTGLEYEIGGMKLFLDFRVNFGLTVMQNVEQNISITVNLPNQSFSVPKYNLDRRTRSFSFMIGFSF